MRANRGIDSDGRKRECQDTGNLGQSKERGCNYGEEEGRQDRAGKEKCARHARSRSAHRSAITA